MSNPSRIEVTASESLAIRQESDVIQLTSHLRRQAVLVGMNVLDQTKVSTAASELARNMLMHGGGGNAQIEGIRRESKAGLRLIFADNGPGIVDVDRAMRPGYSTGAGLGLGLPGAKRLVDDFSLSSMVGEGTTVTILKWAND